MDLRFAINNSEELPGACSLAASSREHTARYARAMARALT